MDAIIVVAGYATRLYPLTKDKPKALLEVGGKKIIEHLMDKLKEVDDVDKVHIVTNEKFYKHFSDWKDSYSSTKKIIIHNDGTKANEDRLGAVGDFHYVVEKENINGPSIVMGGDNLFEFSLSDMIDAFNKHKKSIVAGRTIDQKHLLQKLGVIEIDKKGTIIGFEEKPEEPKSNIGSTFIYLISKDGISELKKIYSEGTQMDNAGDFIRHLLKTSGVHCYSFVTKWFDVGSIDQLEEADKWFKNNSLKN